MKYAGTPTKFAGAIAVLAMALAGIQTAKALEMTPAIAALYTTVSIYPPSASSMTVCYGFVCRRREILDFSAGDRSALTQIMAAGHASAAAERAAAQKAVIWFDRRMGPVIGTNKRVAKADFRYFDDKHNFALEISCGGRSALSRQYAGAADAAQHRGAGRARDQSGMGRGPLAARLSAAAGCHDGRQMGYGRLSG